ncbi:sugar ABC transporter substrate-binding protein [Labrys monachus]|uniref:Ribose transport system substrate-binding protein n=1 Tax=Labrys monachus TaxID=217067 RepID=A0ABU0FLB1_9HYPH|nr:substrate-binding domain-containing protein [Labrys monachus]MDQ0395316.1 ribose transport system substrate-binding protein [Labrys monachus]
MSVRRDLLVATATLAGLLACTAARSAETCSAYPTGTADKIESTAIEARFGATPKPGKALRFAYVSKTLINEFWQDVAAGVKSEAGKYGVKVDVQAAKDEASMVEQLNLAQTMASQKPDALLLSPQSDSNLAPVIKAARAANIPTIIIDDARTQGASVYIGTDQVQIGGQAATFLHDSFPAGGKVAQIEGMAGSPNARLRMQGFRTQLQAYPNLQLVASQPGNWDRLTALNATANILRQHPDLVGVYANNDGMALGVYEAVKNAGAAGKVAVVGTDGIPEAKKSIAAGAMRATVAEFPVEEGRLGVDVALRLIGCQPIPPWVLSPQAVITKDNVAKYPDTHVD